MGQCFSADPVTSQINDSLLQKNREENVVRKLLLLGSGSAGKSTILKQLTRIHNISSLTFQNDQTAVTIQLNCIQSIVTLLKNATLFYERDKETFRDCYINTDERPELINGVKFILENKDLPNERQTYSESSANKMKKLGKLISEIWSIDAIRKTFNLRGGRFFFIENMDYFFDKAETVMDFSYIPTEEDIIYARERTAGIVEHSFKLSDRQINIFDVGGQRNERSKWIHAFDNVDAVIFVAALNHYNVVLFEDETINAMHESLNLFNEITNGKWFFATELILFLNKRDLFDEELRAGHSLSICFGEDAFGWQGPDFWTEEQKKKYDFDPKHSKAKENDKQYFETCFNAALSFIERQYTQKNKNPSRQTYTHSTCATDRNSIEQVFWDIQDIIIRDGLKKYNIL